MDIVNVNFMINKALKCVLYLSSSYIGEVLDGLRHGQGHFYCSESKTTYKGQWFLGKRHGQGRLEYDPDQSGYYDGHWVSNMKQGHGIEQFK